MAGPNSIDPKVFDPANLFDPDYQMTSDDISPPPAEASVAPSEIDSFSQCDVSAELAHIFGQALNSSRSVSSVASKPLPDHHKSVAPQFRRVIDLDELPDPKSTPDTYSIVELDPRNSDQKQSNKV